jgi:hypothetical protein
MHSMQKNMEFLYQLRIWSRTEKTRIGLTDLKDLLEAN